MTTRMMETLESRQMFSVTAIDPAAVPADTTATTDGSTDVVVVEKKTGTASALATHCCTGQHYAEAKLVV